jgi:hypothetical protein
MLAKVGASISSILGLGIEDERQRKIQRSFRVSS